MELAAAYFGRGQMTTALDEVKLAIAADPNFGEAYNLRGLIYANLGDDALAEESFQRALQINPRDADTMHNYGWLPLPAEALSPRSTALFRQALAVPQLPPAPPRTLLTQGVCQAYAGQLAEAERALVRAYELDPTNPFTAVNLSEVLYRRGDYERARFYIRRVNAMPAGRERADAVAGGAHRAQARQPAGRDRVRPAAAQPLPRVARGGGLRSAARSMSDEAVGAAGAGAAQRSAGRLLREAREAQGLHIAALAAAIKVAPRKLELLEADRFDELPDATFTRALAQTVCRALKIDPAPVLALLPPPPGHRLEQRRRRPEHAVSRAARACWCRAAGRRRSPARAIGSPGCCCSRRSRCSSCPPA